MHINDVESAASLVKLVNLMKGSGDITISVYGGNVMISGRVATEISTNLTRVACEALDRFGVDRTDPSLEESKSQ